MMARNMRGAGRLATCLILLLTLPDCGGGGQRSSVVAPLPTPQVLGLVVTPQTANLRAGAELQFTAQVSVTGGASAAIDWLVNGDKGGNSTTGTISDTGRYRAPDIVPGPMNVTVRAVSVADPTKAADSTVALLPPRATITISPASASVGYAGSLQFTAQVSGSPLSQLIWTAQRGSITPEGLYTAPTPGWSEDSVTARLGQDPESSGSTMIQLFMPEPVIHSIDPPEAVAEGRIRIHGEALFGAASHVGYKAEVRFTGPGGFLLADDVQVVDHRTIDASVPLGARSGAIQVLLQWTGHPEKSSNTLPFTRIPNLRIRANRTDLAAGETVPLQWRFLGEESQDQIHWSAEAGSISQDGVFTAPNVSAPDFINVTACIHQGKSCDAFRFYILPFRIEPATPTVELGEEITLSALQGGTQLTVQWSLLNGSGDLLADGAFLAPSAHGEGGTAKISATGGEGTALGSVAVTGSHPGIVHRHREYMDPTRLLLAGTHAHGVAIAGNRAYVTTIGQRWHQNSGMLVNSWGTPKFRTIEVYDITDPAQPIWIDAVESALALPLRTFVQGAYLYQLVSGFGAPEATALARYSLDGERPELDSVLRLPPMAKTAVQDGRLVGATSLNITGSQTALHVLDLRSGTVVGGEMMVPTPSAGALQLSAFTIHGERLYVSFLNTPESSDRFTIAAYEISGLTPILLGTTPLADRGFEAFATEDLLFIEDRVFDVRDGTPTLTSELPVYRVYDIQGTRVVAHNFRKGNGYHILDISDPIDPKVTHNIYDVFHSGAGAWFAGENHLLLTNSTGGLVSVDISAPGGPTERVRAEGYFSGVAFDHVSEGRYMYLAGTSSFGDGGLQIVDVETGETLARMQDAQPSYSVRLAGGIAYLGKQNGLRVIDVSSPTAPFQVTSLPYPTSYLALNDPYLYVLTLDDRFVVLDIADRRSPHLVSDTALPASTATARIHNNILCVATSDAGLLIFDVSQPANPIVVGQLKEPSYLSDVVMAGGMAFMAVPEEGLVIADISNPAEPRVLSRTPIESINPFFFPHTESFLSYAQSVVLHNGLVFVGTNGSASLIHGYDYQQPQHPRLVSMATFGAFIGTAVFAMHSNGDDIVVSGKFGVHDSALRVSYSHPRNTLNLFYEPAAFHPAMAGGASGLSAQVMKQGRIEPGLNHSRRPPAKANYAATILERGAR